MTEEERAKASQSVLLSQNLRPFDTHKQVLLCKTCVDKFDAQKDGSA